MKIHSVRSGFANNSSSSHSVVLHSELDEFGTADGYGWNEFFLKSAEAKERYFATQVYQNMSRIVGGEIARHAVIGLFSRPATEDAGGDFDGIDHQSVWCLPKPFNGREPISLEFARDLRDYLMKPEVGIGGGNDNSRSPYDYGQKDGRVEHLSRDYGSRDLVCRKNGDYWTLFNRETGQKIRISFVMDAPEWTGSSLPELVDFKITDFCPFGCEFCVVPGTLITTPRGEIQIEALCVGDMVVSYDVDGKKIVDTKIEQKFERHYVGEIIDIETEDGAKLSLTPEHEVYTKNRGWVMAGDLTPADEVEII